MNEYLRKKIKKIICNRVFLTIFFAIILVIIAFLLYYGKWKILIQMGIIAILMLVLFYKIFFNLNFINIDRIKKKIQYKKYNNYTDSDELYAKHLKIETFDGTGELTHPSVLYFKDGFCGYKYWMVHTPYHDCKLYLENPCIVVSNDGINFEKIDGTKDPLLPIIDKVNPKTYYNDPNLIYTDKLEIWYRYTVEYDDKANDHIVYRITSKDGKKWTDPEKIFMDKGEKECYMSMSIVYENNKYKYFYFNRNRIYLKESSDLNKWTSPLEININKYEGNLWHGEVKRIEDKYYILFIDRKYGLYIATSNDGINFDNVRKENIYCKTKDYFYNNIVLYKSSIIDDGKYIYLYVPFRFDKVKLLRINNVLTKKWYITLTKIKKEHLDYYFS